MEIPNNQILIKLNKVFLNEEKLKGEVANSYSQKIEYVEEIHILETSYTARISELEKKILILENEKREIEENLLSYTENGQYIDAVRTTYDELVMMGVDINNIELFILT